MDVKPQYTNTSKFEDKAIVKEAKNPYKSVASKVIRTIYTIKLL